MAAVSRGSAAERLGKALACESAKVRIEVGSGEVEAVAKVLQDARGVTHWHLSSAGPFDTLDESRSKPLVLALKKVLSESSIITEFHAVRIRFGDEGARCLAEAFANHWRLTSLRLWDSGLGEEGARSLVEALKRNKCLTSVVLGGNRINDEGWCACSQLLAATDAPLRELSLAHSGVGPRGAAALAEALKHNRRLTKLSLAENGLGPQGAAAISEALRWNFSLARLDLSWVNMGTGASYLGDALRTNTGLLELDLSHNQIDGEGAIALARGLGANTGLHSLILRGNKLKDHGVAALAEAMKTNMDLSILVCEGGEEDTRWQLTAALKRNEAAQQKQVLLSLVLEGGRAVCYNLTGKEVGVLDGAAVADTTLHEWCVGIADLLGRPLNTLCFVKGSDAITPTSALSVLAALSEPTV